MCNFIDLSYGWQTEIIINWILCIIQTIWILLFIHRAYIYFKIDKFWKLPDLTLYYLLGIIIYGILSIIQSIDLIGVFEFYEIPIFPIHYISWQIGVLMAAMLLMVASQLATHFLSFYAVLSQPNEPHYWIIKYVIFCRYCNRFSLPYMFIFTILSGVYNDVFFTIFIWVPIAFLVSLNGLTIATQILYLGCSNDKLVSENAIIDPKQNYADKTFINHAERFAEFQNYSDASTLFGESLERKYTFSSPANPHKFSSDDSSQHVIIRQLSASSVSSPIVPHDNILDYAKPPSWAIVNDERSDVTTSLIRSEHDAKLSWGKIKLYLIVALLYISCIGSTIALIIRARYLDFNRTTLTDYLHIDTQIYDPYVSMLVWIRYFYIFLLFLVVPVVSPMKESNN